MVPIVHKNNDNYDVVSDSESDSDDKNQENIFDEDIDD